MDPLLRSNKYHRILADSLKKIVLEFIVDVRDNILNTVEDRGDLLLVELYFKRIDPLALLEDVHKHVYPHKDKIKRHDTLFFIENRDHIFKGLPADRIDYFTGVLVTSGKVEEENRAVVWKYFETIIQIIEIYIK